MNVQYTTNKAFWYGRHELIIQILLSINNTRLIGILFERTFKPLSHNMSVVQYIVIVNTPLWLVTF